MKFSDANCGNVKPSSRQSQLVLGLAALLVAITLLIYFQIRHHDFLNYDDPHYVTDVPEVLRGLSWDGVRWAFSYPVVSCPHPLTYISLMLDTSLYGPTAAGYLLTNVLLHSCSTLILFLLLWRMTHHVWASFFVAAIFGWHPTHAESVAWVSERKDVLSLFFGMITIAGYVAWQRSKRAFRYVLFVVLPFALALLSKPSMVVLPCVLMLLDLWPLGRLKSGSELRLPHSWFSQTSQVGAGILRLLPEKIPLFTMSVIMGALTIQLSASMENNAPWDLLPFWKRVGFALEAYSFYLSKFILPTDLAALHIHPRKLADPGLLVGIGALLGLFSLFCALRLHHQPWLMVGWLWFLGTLVPVIGIFQNGMQLTANRYTYFPYIGLAIAVFYGLGNYLDNWRGVAKGFFWSIIGVWLGWLAWVAYEDAVPAWRNSENLWRKTLDVNPHNEIALAALGNELARQGRLAESYVYQSAALRIVPYSPGVNTAIQELRSRLKSREAVPGSSKNSERK